MDKDFITINDKGYSHNDINLIREFFTDAQWDCIYDALSEFQDHPNNHTPHYDSEDDIAGRTQYIISRVFTSAF